MNRKLRLFGVVFAALFGCALDIQAEALVTGKVIAVAGGARLQVLESDMIKTFSLSHLRCAPNELPALERWLQNTVFGKPVSVTVISQSGGNRRAEFRLGDGTVVNQVALREGLCSLESNDPDPRGLYKHIHERTLHAPADD